MSARLAIAGLGLVAVAGVLWWRAAEGRRDRRDAAAERSQRERIAAKGSRDRPAIGLDPSLAPLLDPDAPVQLDLPPEERDRARRSLPPPEPANVFEAAIASVERERAAEEHTRQARRGAGSIAPGPGHHASNPNDVELLGMRPRPGPSGVGPANVAAGQVEAGPPDPLKVPPPNSGAPVKPPATDPEIVKPGLPATTVRRVIRTAMGPIRDCYQHELAAHPGLEGILQVTFTIERDGSVAEAAGTGLIPAVATCVCGVIRGLRFPAPDGDGTVTVRYPFAFRAVP